MGFALAFLFVFFNERFPKEKKKRRSILSVIKCVPLSGHAGGRLPGTKSPGCQETHPEDDGREGKASFSPGLRTLNWCSVEPSVFPGACCLTGRGHDLHGARKGGYVTIG